jgi:hypothetical protein
MKYKHVCKGCSKEFYGRRNQEFHDLQCKIDYNNEKAALLRKDLKDNKISQKNYLIIREAYAVSKNSSIPLMKLINKGLILTAPIRRVKTPKNGYEIFLANGYGYRIFTQDGTQSISLYKEEELNNF